MKRIWRFPDDSVIHMDTDKEEIIARAGCAKRAVEAMRVTLPLIKMSMRSKKEVENLIIQCFDHALEVSHNEII